MTHFSADGLRSRLGQTSMSLQSSLEPYPEARGDLQPVRKVAAPPRVVAPQIDSRHEITGVNTDAGERGRIDLEAAADVERQAVFGDHAAFRRWKDRNAGAFLFSLSPCQKQAGESLNCKCSSMPCRILWRAPRSRVRYRVCGTLIAYT